MTSRRLVYILKAKEPEFSHLISDLEKLSGKKSYDVQTIADAATKFRAAAKQLSLDPEDTTLKEMYHALNHKVIEDSKNLAAALDISPDLSPEEVIKKCIGIISSPVSGKEVWCVKQSVLKKQLKENQPKKIMKFYGVRSIDSLLKRESIAQILIFARLIEPDSWINKYIDQGSKIKNNDFNLKKIKFEFVGDKRKKQLQKADVSLNRIIFSHPELSDIVISPPAKRFNGDVLFYLDSLINHINRALSRSLFYRYLSMSPDLTRTMKNIRQFGFIKGSLQSRPFSWSAVTHSVDKYKNKDIIERLYPDTSTDEISLIKLSDVGPILSFWKDPFILSSEKNEVISAHLADVLINSVNENEFDKSYYGGGAEMLHNDLFGRYLTHIEIIDEFFGSNDLPSSGEVF